MRVRAPQDAGFTLVEALVSLFVFSLIAAGCMAMLMQSVDSQRRIGEAQGALREVQLARALLSADMAQLVARSVREADGTRRPALIGGDADVALAFVRAAAEPEAETGAATTLAFIEYALDENGQLVRRSRVYLDAVADTPVSERPLLAGAQDVRFEFHDGAGWRTSWLSGGLGQPMPRAVALIAETPRYGEIRIEALVGASP